MIDVEFKGLDKAIRTLDKIHSPISRRKILNAVGRQVLKNARTRTKNQVDLDGKPYGDYSDKTRHKRPRKKSRKMLTRLTRAKHMNIISLSSDHVKVGFKNPVVERIAIMQQFGNTKHMKAKKKFKGSGDQALKPATRKQARGLIDAGFKKKRESGGYQTPSIKWITENMNIGKAGIALRALTGGSKSSWGIVLPARSFLGITQDEVDQLTQIIMGKMKSELAKTS